MENLLSKHIEETPGVCGGKPRVAGRRITVQNVAIWHDRMGMTPDQIADEHGLTLAEIYAALAYYHDNRQEIDQSIRADDEFIAQLKAGSVSKLKGRIGG